MSVELTVAISIGCTLLGTFFGYKGFKRQDIKDIEEKTRVMTEISMTLKDVSKDVKFIMEELTDTKEKMAEITFDIQALKSGHGEVVREYERFNERFNEKVKNFDERIKKLEDTLYGKFSIK